MFHYFFSASGTAAVGTSAVVFPALVTASSANPPNTANSRVVFPSLLASALDYAPNTGLSSVAFRRLVSAAAGYPANTAVSAARFHNITSTSTGIFESRPGSDVLFASLQLQSRGLQQQPTLPPVFFQTPVVGSVGGVSCGLTRPAIGSPAVFWLFVDNPGRYSLSYSESTGVTLRASGLTPGDRVFDFVRGLYRITVTLSEVDEQYVFSTALANGNFCLS